ncbi:class IV lanthionine synthetase LanL [Actinomadura sp. DC4]|uniref:class IV lanthionine synthetase LanL n=1 Tax=Actinomadura sp. DC4 TaxID=3055069 RepID=UPI0025B11153|nr:class IV lanthionine synthetase LanL [Actinomadura sp. DC4]MDN3353982.1 class IV lanthionine synthetase LanL [Actinomadura sp. DC4]
MPAPSSRYDPEIYARVVRARLPAGWRLDRAGTWTHAAPEGARLRDQGWKIHLSAVPPSAERVLDTVTPVLAEAGCPFKFAASPAEIARLTGRHFDRASAGKFLTVYPPDDAGVAALAEALHRATEGLAGPRILSDRPYRPGSLVHFRFGGFVRKVRLAGNGVYEPVVTAPDGTCVPDRRSAWFEPPSWAPSSPFGEPAEAPGAAPRGVLIGDRFLLRGAIRHANKGGVFRATDRTTGREVVVKQGRRYVEVRPDGGDVRDLLRNEARLLGRLAATGVVPRVHALIELPEHAFLAVEAIDGVSLSVHLQRLHRGGGPDERAVLRTAGRLVDLVAAVHREGVVIRDLTPANVLVLPDGDLRLIDLELAGTPDEDAVPGGSPGYAAPEQWTARRATPAADLYGLGAILFALTTGAEPILANDDRDTHRRLDDWLTRAARDLPLAAALRPLILALLREDPALRPPLDRVQEALHETAGNGSAGGRGHGVALGPAGRGPGAGRDDVERLLGDGLAYLVGSGGRDVDPDRLSEPGAGRWWPADLFGATTDPGNLYYGAAGILGVLATALRHRPTPEIRTATERAARHLERAAAREPLVLPGLHFGRSGTYWALLEAGIALQDEDLIARTADAAERLPVSGPVPDVSHGIAGAGLTALRFWRHTGRETFLGQAGECADALLTAAVRDGDGIVWPVPPHPPQLPDGATHHGFAHGTAGIAAFLLDAATATGRADCREAADQAGRTLLAATLWGTGGTARWSAGPGDDVPLTGWCSGAAGVGGFLVRLWRATGAPALLTTAEGAAAAVRHDIWQSRPVNCHGNAGSIGYLLDLADATGEESYRDRAREAVSALAARAVVRDGLLLTPDHTGLEVFPGWGVGTAGVTAALLRLDGSPVSLFMPPIEAALRTCGAMSHRSSPIPSERKRR